MRSPHYEQDDKTFSADAYKVKGHGAIAWHVLGWDTEPDEDTEWTGQEVRTGNVVCMMVGDDRRFAFEPDDIEPIEREEYCGGCGQIGCTADGYERGSE